LNRRQIDAAETVKLLTPIGAMEYGRRREAVLLGLTIQLKYDYIIIESIEEIGSRGIYGRV